MIDAPKDINVVIKCLPAIEILILVPKVYPSSEKPLLLMNTPFYEPFNEHLLEELN